MEIRHNPLTGKALRHELKAYTMLEAAEMVGIELSQLRYAVSKNYASGPKARINGSKRQYYTPDGIEELKRNFMFMWRK